MINFDAIEADDALIEALRRGELPADADELTALLWAWREEAR